MIATPTPTGVKLTAQDEKEILALFILNKYGLQYSIDILNEAIEDTIKKKKNDKKEDA